MEADFLRSSGPGLEERITFSGGWWRESGRQDPRGRYCWGSACPCRPEESRHRHTRADSPRLRI